MKKILIAAVALVAGAAMADKVTLKSGSVLTGQAGDIRGDVLKFVSDDVGEVEVKVANIVALESARTHIVRYEDGQRVEKAVTIANGELREGSAKLDMTGVKEIDPVVETWHGSVNVSLQADRGNTHGNSASVLANLNRRWEDDRVNFDFGYYYSKTGVSKSDWTKSKDKIELEGQYDHFWSTRVYNYLNARYDRDVIAGLDRRVKLGIGFGFQWLENRVFEATGKWNFNQEVGVAWVNDKYKVIDPNRNTNYATLRYAHHLTWEPKWTKGLSFFHNFEYLPEVDDWSICLFKADFGFTTMLFWNIDLLGKVEWDYNSKPSGDRHESDLRYLLGLGYKW